MSLFNPDENEIRFIPVDQINKVGFEVNIFICNAGILIFHFGQTELTSFIAVP